MGKPEKLITKDLTPRAPITKDLTPRAPRALA